MSAHFSPMNTLHSSKVEWTMYTDGMKLAGPKVNYVQVFTSTELHLERKNNTKRPHVKTKPKEFSSLCHCYHRVYNGDKCPLRITLLDRFAWKPGQFTHLGAWWSTKIWRMNCRWNGRRENFQSKQQNIFLSLPWRSFQLWREREDTVICRILKLGGPWKFFASWHQIWATLPQKQKFHHERDDVARSHLSLQVCSSLL